MLPIVVVTAFILYKLPPETLSTLLCEQSLELCTGLYRVLGENMESYLRWGCFGLVLKAAEEIQGRRTEVCQEQ